MEVFYSGVWGTVCHNEWDLNDANVVCKMLGYGKAVGAPGSATFGEGSGRIWLDRVGCLGTEDNLAECPSMDLVYHNCQHNLDAGVICANEDIDGKT